MRDTAVPVEQKPNFKVHLRVEGVPEDVILKDEEQMKQINETVEKLKDGSTSVLDDLKYVDRIFSEESSRVIYEMGNVEMFELGQISMTVQCHSCLKHVPEGLKLCGCGVRRRPDEETINKIRARFQALIVPYYLTQVKRSRGKKHGEAHWQQDHHTAMDAKGGAWKKQQTYLGIEQVEKDAQYRKSQLDLGWTETYCRYLDFLTKIDVSHNALSPKKSLR